MYKCKICQKEDETVLQEGATCDWCWHGMRMYPEGWKKELEEQGIEVKRGMGYKPAPGGGIMCGDPYKETT